MIFVFNENGIMFLRIFHKIDTNIHFLVEINKFYSKFFVVKETSLYLQ